MRSILIATSFAEEFNALKEAVKYPTQFKIACMNYVEGEWGSNKVHLICGGQGRSQIQKSLETFLEKNMVHDVILAGYCGALSENVRVGDVFLPYEFILDPRIQKKPSILIEKMKIFSAEFKVESIVTVDTPVKTVFEKKRLYELTKCPIVDMESFEVAEYLFFEEIPFYILKTVLDDSSTEIGNVKDLKNNVEIINPKMIKALDRLISLV